MDELVGYLSGNSELVGILSEKDQLYGELSIPATLGDPYTGDYDVIPTSGFQLLPTSEKYLSDDIIVHPITYAEVSNVYGGYTATIGG